ncbi:hypothetical protein CHUUTOTORO_01600 [Serratia phage vB_SmaM-ChuuTotoro]|nr:hypothetical protein CHUUTOTORO_01600 [Serratia phage vB_SmaM-ChuuTotoro]
MFTIETRADVVAVARAFGPEALRHAVKFGTLGAEASAIIRDCQTWAREENVVIEECNDGNNYFMVEAVFKSVKIGNEYFTGLTEIDIVRHGFGAYRVTVEQAMNNGLINSDQLGRVLGEIAARNAAAKWLFHPN